MPYQQNEHITNNSSIDQKEIQKFNKSAEEWWDKSGEFAMLHKITPLRCSYIADQIKIHFNTTSQEQLAVIDVGCGGGLAASAIYNMGYNNIYGIDANPNNAFAAKEYAKLHNMKIEYQHNTLEQFIQDNPTTKFDIVLCLEVIEHVANYTAFIKNLLKITNNGGIVILSTINRSLRSYVEAILIGEYITKWVKPGTHDYNKLVKPSDIFRSIKGENAIISDLRGLRYQPLLNKWVLSDKIETNYFATINKIA